MRDAFVRIAASAVSAFATDVLLNMEDAIGSAFDDTLIGDSGANLLFGAMLGALFHYVLMRKHCAVKTPHATLSPRS